MARLNTTRPGGIGSTSLITKVPGRDQRTVMRNDDEDLQRKEAEITTERKEKEEKKKKKNRSDCDEKQQRQRMETVSDRIHSSGSRFHKNTTTTSDFDIFRDDEDEGEVHVDDDDNDGSEKDTRQRFGYNHAGKNKKRITATKERSPLKLAEVNDLSDLHRASRTPLMRSRRATIKNDHDEENDPLEDDMDGHSRHTTRDSYSADVLSSIRPSPTRRHMRQTPGQGGYRRLFGDNRRPEISSNNEEEEEEEEEICSHDDSSDLTSLDGFIVSDNEELSCHDTSDTETDNEKVQGTPPQSPPSQHPPTGTAKRRLIRGRRPSHRETSGSDETPSRQGLPPPFLRLEPSLPEAIRLPSLTSTTTATTPDPKTKKPFRDDFNISEKLNHLSLDSDNGNDHSSFKQKNDMYNTAAVLLGSPTQKSKTAFQTPPPSPSKNRLRSPTKAKARIPATPYRESTDAFWNQEVTNDWVDQHSPQKEPNKSSLRAVEELLCDFSEPDQVTENDNNDGSDSSTTMSIVRRNERQRKPLSKTAQKRAEAEKRRTSRERKKSFDNKKAAMAEEFFKILDNAVTGGKIQREAASTGGVRIIWLATLKSTAGRARYSRAIPPSPANNNDIRNSSSSPASVSVGHNATIELAEHIVDDEDRLINTITHEYCHLANYMISGNTRDRPHGSGFKKWALQCTKTLQDHPVYGGGRVIVTTKHDYKINYKYIWSCEDCGNLYQRHSRSINPLVVACGVCRGRLQQIKPKPRRKPGEKPMPLLSDSDRREGKDEKTECVVACARQHGHGGEQGVVDDVTRVFEGVSLSGGYREQQQQ